MTGTYIGARYCPVSEDKISSVANRISAMLDNTAINKDDIHSTVIYSRLPETPKTGTYVVEYKVKVKGFDVFGPEKDCLVLLIKSKDLVRLNADCMAAGATSNYPIYNPHITIGYNVNEKAVRAFSNEINKIINSIGDLYVREIYVDPLKENWADDYKVSAAARMEYGEKDPCWKDYEMVGLKQDKNGRLVPNCVPKKSLKKKIESRLFSVK